MIEAEKESDEAMSDLLVCLGQEAAKVERLTAALEQKGVDVSVLLKGFFLRFARCAYRHRLSMNSNNERIPSPLDSLFQ